MTLHVVFCLGDTEYALPVDVVLQMESFSGATAVPGAPPYVAGIVSVRGLVVPVIDLRIRFGLPPAALTPDTRIIVTCSQDRKVALLVDKAREVLKLNEQEHQPAAGAISERSSGFVAFVHSLGPRLLLLVDLPKILGEVTHDQQPRARLDDPGTQQQPALPG
jgi:purine-binding chemotaxis protein CheW